MSPRGRPVAACALLALATGAGACGKKGPPLPPLRPQPARVAELTAYAAGARVELRFSVPAANADGTTPAVVERIEIYALADRSVPAEPPAAAAPPGETPATPPPVPASDVMQSENLIVTVPVRPAGTPPDAETNRPAPGESATVHHDLAELLVVTGPPPILRYVAVAAGRGRRAPPSPVVEIALAERPLPPAGLAMGYDNTTITASWRPTAEGHAYHVEEIDAADPLAEAARLTTRPVSEPTLSVPVTFGVERCFTVRAVASRGRGSVEGPASRPVCVMPQDRFPPPAPADLQAIAEIGGVALTWRGVEAADLAGYLILRGDGPGETLQPLTREPVAGRSYRDTTVTSGVTYTYAVVAVDRAGNSSEPSDRQAVTAR